MFFVWLEQQSLARPRATDLRRKTRANRMLIAMVAIFVCCWLPLNVLHLLNDYGAAPTFYESRYYMIVFLATHLIAMSSTIYNPFLYAWMNENFQKEFKHVLPRLFSAKACMGRDVSAGRGKVRGRRVIGSAVVRTGSPYASLETFEARREGGKGSEGSRVAAEGRGERGIPW